MSTAELKLSLHKLIESINDNHTLMAIYALLSKKEEAADFWEELSTDEKKAIEEGIEQAERGDLLSHEEVMKEIRRKFNL